MITLFQIIIKGSFCVVRLLSNYDSDDCLYTRLCCLQPIRLIPHKNKLRLPQSDALCVISAFHSGVSLGVKVKFMVNDLPEESFRDKITSEITSKPVVIFSLAICRLAIKNHVILASVYSAVSQLEGLAHQKCIRRFENTLEANFTHSTGVTGEQSLSKFPANFVFRTREFTSCALRLRYEIIRKYPKKTKTTRGSKMADEVNSFGLDIYFALNCFGFVI